MRDPVTRSHNEIVNLIVKAARGSGFPAGLAEDIGAAAGWLCRNGRDGVAIALDAIGHGLQPPKLCTDRTFGTVSAASHIAPLVDLAVAEDCAPVLHDVDQPLFALGLCGVASGTYGCTIRLGDWAEVSCGRLVRADDRPPSGFALTPSAASGLLHDVPQSGDLIVSPEHWHAASELAARTYVPATAASRSRAGAAIDDND